MESWLAATDTRVVCIATKLAAVSPLVAEREDISVSDGAGERTRGGDTRGAAPRDTKRLGSERPHPSRFWCLRNFGGRAT